MLGNGNGDKKAPTLLVWATVGMAVAAPIGGFWYLAANQGDTARRIETLEQASRHLETRVDELERHGSPQIQTMQQQVSSIDSRIASDEAAASIARQGNVVQDAQLTTLRRDVDDLRRHRDDEEKDNRARDDRITRLETTYRGRNQP